MSEIFLIPRRTQRDIIIHVNMSSSKVNFILVRFLMTLEISRMNFEKSSISYLMETLP